MLTIQMIVRGKVQGVFFRSSVRRKAQELGLLGYAKNLENGDVEIVVQGSSGKIALMQSFILANPGAAVVKGLKEKEIDLGTLNGFLVF